MPPLSRLLPEDERQRDFFEFQLHISDLMTYII